jgi:hypothetical protein
MLGVSDVAVVQYEKQAVISIRESGVEFETTDNERHSFMDGADDGGFSALAELTEILKRRKELISGRRVRR